MSDEAALRTALIVIMMVVMPIGVYHRVQSHSTGEKLDRRHEGMFVLTTLRPLGGVFFFGTRW